MAVGSARTWYWLIARHRNAGMEVLTLRSPGGGRMLPVFGSEEGAEAYLKLGARHGGWRVRPSSAGELTSLLLGLLAEVERVAFDPAPEVLVGATSDVPGVRREDFVELLVGESDGAPVTSKPGRSTRVAKRI